MPTKTKTEGVNKYPEGDVRNGPCEEHINAALFFLRAGLDGEPIRLNEECHPIIRKAIKAIEKHFKLKSEPKVARKKRVEPKTLRSFKGVGQRVIVLRCGMGSQYTLPEGTLGTVAQTRKNDSGVWVRLDQRLTGELAKAHEFDHVTSKVNQVLTWPEDCVVVGKKA